MSELTHSESIVVARPAGELYDLVSDVTRMGEWSPVCRACWWDEGSGPEVGAWFTGRNEVPGRTWETRSQVVAADPGREFAWVVGDFFARWGYRFTEVEAGTLLTESWEFLPAGIALFGERYGPTAAEEVADRTRTAKQGIPVTLAAIKAAAEAR